jgi:hypothetical protein
MSHATEGVDTAPVGGPLSTAARGGPAYPCAAASSPAGSRESAAAGVTDGAGGALTREQVEAITQARRQGRKISRAATVAAFSGWTLAFFAFVTLLSGLFSLASLLLGVGLGVVAYIELRGSRGLRRLDETAPRQLGFNQIALGAMVAVYCGWGMWKAVAGPGPYDSYIAAGGDTAEMIEPIDRLHRSIMSAFYALLICVSVVAQGCASLYYFTRRRLLLAYLSKTPAWVIEALRVVAH